MPLHDFRCPACDFVLKDKIVSSPGKEVICPQCKKVMQPDRIYKKVGILFKGTGFYSTDKEK